MGGCYSKSPANEGSIKSKDDSSHRRSDSPHPAKYCKQPSPAAGGHGQNPGPSSASPEDYDLVAVKPPSSGETATTPNPKDDLVPHHSQQTPATSALSTLSASERRFGRFYPVTEPGPSSHISVPCDDHKCAPKEDIQSHAGDRSSSDSSVQFSSVRSRAST
ncbi:hypothetical protein BR93DRAFT_967301 [Coniochaeta sp. PMI_546]|nr:hypothetical protein BR93DRAFT_967301 [Coniochaeta sp. PMI_546]